jgi:hypothetical protein
MLQQISFALQQLGPQQRPLAPQPVAKQGGVVQVLAEQNGLSAGQRLPQVPQLSGSFLRFVQLVPQQEW